MSTSGDTSGESPKRQRLEAEEVYVAVDDSGEVKFDKKTFRDIAKKYRKVEGLGKKGVKKMAKSLKQRRELRHKSMIQEADEAQLVATEIFATNDDAGGIDMDDGVRKSYNLSQKELASQVDIGTQRKLFDFSLPGGPFTVNTSTNGRYMVTGSRGGQFTVLDRHTMNPLCSEQLDEPILDVTFLHDHTLFAAAQRKYTYIYDSATGAEVHCLKDHLNSTHLEFLPKHYLLVSGSETGEIRYRDVSTGQHVAKIVTRQGPIQSLRQNPSNAVVVTGHTRGHVCMWTPNLKEPALKMLAHFGQVTALDVTSDGKYLVTCGTDSKWKVYDLRKPSEELQRCSFSGRAPTSVDISFGDADLAFGFGSSVSVFRGADVFRSGKAPSTYLKNSYNGQQVRHIICDRNHDHLSIQVSSVRFVPYEDLLLVGTSGGFNTMLVPGAGYTQFDSYVANPFETTKQRRETQVRSLLEKLQPDMIALDANFIGRVQAPKKVPTKPLSDSDESEADEESFAAKHKMRGKSKAGKRQQRMNKMRGEAERKRRARRAGESKVDVEEKSLETARAEHGALARFYVNKNE
ncbi:U3 small nucleolar RNA-associated protein, putative [Perkinsus marinus ATCC 50983]|uniref:U3 small nucleolar RNA-associated protein, putative n=1 Tax=Perkinsus marinus (strain ATCC 50983 / TXsc) TaxID=423536 RepID=C5L3M1_PERM5|nr:U3 small nucleolar RNA-associated protein, putative [Perkinsus marinus ATCC 50983]EER08600.1 U3 small nucleolar RNA-associated protein, putative [Perkinsus marinus ATCC 50983]|eukprot:XP_002776784.1 U3 small nucleolar RNA-associated protein, putative [Perkinsus marinus ATCC 50983]